jgi:putative flippase GtrA
MRDLAAFLGRWGNTPLGRTFIFALAGTVGFLVDSGVLQLLAGVLHMQVHLARVVSFLIAMTATWQINRRFTFREGRQSQTLVGEWLRYFASSLLGGATNYAAFAISIAVSPFIRSHLVLGVAIGSLVGMVTNYVLYSRFVFKASTPAGGIRGG